MSQHFWLITTGLMWFIYSALTAYGACKFPLYSLFEKMTACMLALALPFLGAYLVNYNMGYRLSNNAKKTFLYELPWWASFGINSKDSSIDDD